MSKVFFRPSCQPCLKAYVVHISIICRHQQFQRIHFVPFLCRMNTLCAKTVILLITYFCDELSLEMLLHDCLRLLCIVIFWRCLPYRHCCFKSVYISMEFCKKCDYWIFFAIFFCFLSASGFSTYVLPL